MKYTDIEDTFKCDECEKTFKGKDIHLVDPASNIDIIMPPASFKYVNKHGDIMEGEAQASLEKKDRLICCPHCEKIHLFGFYQVTGDCL